MFDQFLVDGRTWNQTFMRSNETTTSSVPADGFLGFAYSSVANAGTTTVMETLLHAGRLDEPIFSIYYGHNVMDTTNATSDGAILIGGSMEDTYVDGALDWIPMAKGRTSGEYEFWRSYLITMTGSKTIHGEKEDTVFTYGMDNATYGSAVFDTGTSYLGVPSDRIEDIYASIGMNWTAILRGDHIPLCSEFTSDWSITFNFTQQFGKRANPTTLTISGDILAQSGFANRRDACFPPFDPSGSSGFYLIGARWLQNIYTVWDFGSNDVKSYEPRLGIGALKPEWAPDQDST
jgi:saccharopepsin